MRKREKVDKDKCEILKMAVRGEKSRIRVC